MNNDNIFTNDNEIIAELNLPTQIEFEEELQNPDTAEKTVDVVPESATETIDVVSEPVEETIDVVPEPSEETMDIVEDPLNEANSTEPTLTRKKRQNKSQWKRNEAKVKRNKGEQYVNKLGNVVPPRTVQSGENTCICKLFCRFKFTDADRH
ncbi:uncharacterized protein LOC126887010 [Diabrotica virgifera virgifera]|uniref:Uncharacterized protein n=1 Tax=Diabrotica virgifera virgifera TaxID=50390 RepID=A0ABM5KJH9_DIAVI|nr:uncharacterized protein LOC126887010 [Diabrotica virgifera virgifera]XP_050510263.1 uncharacterized protein LOC126887010 [Diabrotica virgifera virgifera]